MESSKVKRIKYTQVGIPIFNICSTDCNCQRLSLAIIVHVLDDEHDLTEGEAVKLALVDVGDSVILTSDRARGRSLHGVPKVTTNFAKETATVHLESFN